MDLSRLHAQWRLGRLAPEAWPALAADLLTQGVDAPALQELSAAWASPEDEVQALATQLFRESGMLPITEVEARWIVARATAEDMLAGAMSSRDGVTTLAWLSADLAIPAALLDFARLNAEDEILPSEDPDVRATWFHREALAAARTFLDRVPS